MIRDSIYTLLGIVNEMSPYLLIGFLFAGVLHVLVPRNFYRKYLGKENFKSVFMAALFGIPLPLCSCGVIPTAMSLRREGVSKGATISFLTATPQTGIDSILATYAVFGLSFSIMRPLAALVTALFSGLLASVILRKDREDFSSIVQPQEDKLEKRSNKLYRILKYGFFDMLQDIGGHLIVGLLIAGLITVFIPDSFILSFSERPLLEMLVVLLISIPMYVCATGSIPIAAALMLKGLSPGAALVLLMAGPATNMAAIMVIKKVMGLKSLWIYLVGIIVGAISFGLIINNFMPHEWFQTVAQADLCCSPAITPWWQWLSSGLFIILLSYALICKYFKKVKTIEMEKSVVYKVSGMSCNHCKNSVEQNVKKIKNVSEALVNLEKGELSVTGTAEREQIKNVVESLGFTFE